MSLDEGWGFPASGRRFHYFEQGETISLCGKWMFSGPRQPDGEIVSPEDCVTCRRKLKKL